MLIPGDAIIPSGIFVKAGFGSRFRMGLRPISLLVR